MPDRLTGEQPVWECRWSALGGVSSASEPPRREYTWWCQRTPGAARPVMDNDCERCPFWEQDPLIR
jgi:hypothetical protein